MKNDGVLFGNYLDFEHEGVNPSVKTSIGEGFQRVSVGNSDPFADYWSSFLRYGADTSTQANKSLKVVDLFSSVGGLTLGVKEAMNVNGLDLDSKLACDIDELALKIYRNNFFTDFTHFGSVRNLVESRVKGQGAEARFAFHPEAASFELDELKGNVDLVVAGPPCQGHSTLNNHSRGDDPRNSLYLTVPAVAMALGAKHIIIENVPNVIHDVMGVVSSTRQLLKTAGYEITEGVIKVSDLGWAQTRKRYFMIASREVTPLPLKELIMQMKREPLPLSWAIEDLLNSYDQADLFNSTPDLSSENQKRIEHLFDNDIYNLPNAQRPVCHQEGTTYTSVYGRMSWDKPAPTLTTGFMSPGRGRYVHPIQRRVMTPHEAARVQGFPDYFDFLDKNSGLVKRTNLAKWIGDAVPSFMGFVAMNSILLGE